MPQSYLEKFLPDLKDFDENTRRFHAKMLTTAEYKHLSGGFGSYAQRGGARHMLRLRMAGGRLTRQRLRFIADICEKYNIPRIKLTTCQSVQLHDINAASLCNIMEAAWRAGMISRGGGGDFPRNIMATPLSGVLPGEAFNVMPYAEAAGEYLMGFIRAVRFPRKLKVAFSSSFENETHATFRDLGFVARPDHTFDVYAAGGLGIRPRMGVCVARDVPPEDILYHIKAMVDTFTAYGNYENRAKSRSRFLQETLGTDGLTEAYQEKLKIALRTENLRISVSDLPVRKEACGEAALKKRMISQKQQGLYAVFYQPVGGFLSPIKAAQLSRAIDTMEEVELRLTPGEGLYFINCNAREADLLYDITRDGAQTLFETSTACVGADTCQVGIGRSQALLSACILAVRRENFADGVLPCIHISGCPSSCAAHQTASIGLRGGMKQTPSGPVPSFSLFFGGCARQGQEVITDSDKSIPAQDIPSFFVELGRMITADSATWDSWITQNRDRFLSLVEKYAA